MHWAQRVTWLSKWPFIGGTQQESISWLRWVSLIADSAEISYWHCFIKNPAFPPPFYVGAGTFNTFTIPTLATGSREYINLLEINKRITHIVSPGLYHLPMLRKVSFKPIKLGKLKFKSEMHLIAPKGAPPKVPAREAYVESAIWSIDTKTHELHGSN